MASESDSLRVLIVLRQFYCASMPIGGAERQALRLAKKLQEIGVAVKIVTGLWDWGQSRRQFLDGIPVARHFTAWGMFDIRGLRKFGQYLYLLSLFLYLVWHRHKYDVIHCHSAMFEAAVSVLAGQWLGKPTLVRAMASGAWGDLTMVRQERSIRGTGWMLKKIRAADAVVALNSEAAQEMTDLGVSKDKLFCIPNGIEALPAWAGRETGTRASESVCTMLVVGRLHPQKGVETLLRALPQVSSARPDVQWRLLVAGTGPLQSELLMLAQELEIDGKVNFLGHVERIDELLEQGDLFVLPSFSEGMSNALLEAMNHGLACVVSDIPGNRDMIQDGENGLTFSPGDAADLARTLSTLVADANLRAKLGRRAWQTVQMRYSLGAVAGQYRQLYDLLRFQQARI